MTIARPRADGAAAAAAVAAVAFLNGLYGDWLDDDPVAITGNRDVDCNREHAIFDNDFWGEPLLSAASHLSFRPLTTWSFRLQNCWVGFDGVSFHAVNVALHVLNVALIHRALLMVLPNSSQRCLATLLFALHAVHVEVVTNTVGRSELLAACFFLLACLIYRPASRPTTSTTAAAIGHACRSLPRIALAILLSGAAMLAKEVGLSALLVCATLDVATALLDIVTATGPPPPASSRRWRIGLVLSLLVRLLVLGVGGATLLAWRLSMNGWRAPRFASADNAAAFCETRLCRVLSYSHLYSINLRLLCLPYDLAHDWSMTTVPNLRSLTDPRLPLAALPYVLIGALVAAAITALVREARRRPVSQRHPQPRRILW